MFSRKGILVVDDLYSGDQCKELIDLFESGTINTRVTTEQSYHSVIATIVPHGGMPISEQVRQLLIPLTKVIDNTIKIYDAHIDKRENGDSMPMHFDSAYAAKIFTSVTYLCDDFDGGETIIRPPGETTDKFDVKIKPKIGRTVFFDGGKMFHGVTPPSGIRYTMPVWYSHLPADFPAKHKWWLS